MTDHENEIDEYLDDLCARLRGDPATVRRILVETESHLRDAVDAGATPAEAIARFGDSDVVAMAHQRTSRRPWSHIVGQLVATAFLLGSLALVAVGLSGLMAAGMDAAFGPRFVAGDTPAVTYSTQRCADFEEYTSTNMPCAAAAARHHTDEVETYRIAAGVVGAVFLAVRKLARRRWPHLVDLDLPASTTSAVAATAFAFGLVIIAAQASAGIDAGTAAGLGQWLSAAIIALAFMTIFTHRFVHRLRHPLA